MSPVPRGAAIAAVLLASFGSAAAAADGSADQGAEQVVVTAARVEQPVSDVIGSVSVITREDIQRRAVQSVQDLLRGETSVGIVNTGGLGKLSNVFLRGADAEQVLVLVDGVRMGSATSGTTAFEFLPIDQIERIEIVRGPRSSLYGSDAIGGVIQIFTRRAQGAGFSAGAGSHDTYSANASFGAASERSWFSVAGNSIRSDGYNSCAGSPTGGGCFTHEPDRDGYENTSGTVRAGYRWDERAEIEASALYASGTTEFDGTFTNETDFTQRVLTLHGSVRPLESWKISFVAGDSRDDRDGLYDDPLAADRAITVSRFDNEKRSASLQSDLSFGDAQMLMLGADYVEDRVESTTPYDETSRDNIGVFGQYELHYGSHHLLLSARHDDNEQFGTYDTGSIGWKWALSRNLSLTAAWGSAFGAPTFNDLYFPGFSNPQLDPERARSYELGIAGRAGGVRWSLTAFENRVDELIVFDPDISAPDNLNEARIRGIEAQANAALGAWTLGLGYAGLDPRNRTPGANYDNILPRRARHSGHLEVGRAFGPFDARVRLTAEGSRYDNIANSTRIGGYAIVDLVVDYALSRQWSVQGKVGNAFDRNYRTVHLYNQDDRTFFVNVRYQPQ